MGVSSIQGRPSRHHESSFVLLFDTAGLVVTVEGTARMVLGDGTRRALAAATEAADADFSVELRLSDEANTSGGAATASGAAGIGMALLGLATAAAAF